MNKIASANGVIAINNKYADINSVVAIRDYINRTIEAFASNPLYEHKCINCGGTVELDYEKAIFICPYCGSHYALNTSRINDVL